MRRKRKVAEIDYETAIAKSKDVIKKYETLIESTKEKLKEEISNLKKLEKNFATYKEQKEEEIKIEKAKKLAQSILESGKSFEEIEAFLKSQENK